MGQRWRWERREASPPTERVEKAPRTQGTLGIWFNVLEKAGRRKEARNQRRSYRTRNRGTRKGETARSQGGVDAPREKGKNKRINNEKQTNELIGSSWF